MAFPPLYQAPALVGAPLVPDSQGIDGTTHFLNDHAGLGQGFRYTNAWLAAAGGSAFPPTFYAGCALGSLNFWMHVLTSLLFGIGVAWFGFPYLDELFTSPCRLIAAKSGLLFPQRGA